MGVGGILAGLGFAALTTSSGASAGVLGRRDGKVTRDEALAHCRAIVAATELPVSADLGKGFGDAPEEVAETIQLAAQAGLVGGSIEDSTGKPGQPFYGMAHAVERMAAAVEAARSLPFAFTLTARAENFIRGNPDLDDTIVRLQAYEKVGPTCFAPGLVAAVRAVQRPEKAVQLHGGDQGKSFTVAELEAAGVRRISLATSPSRGHDGPDGRGTRGERARHASPSSTAR
jgi:2-methylisocitrate lyase-like PEP mutase family enzyme